MSKLWFVTFVVEASTTEDACRQAERYLCTGNRVVDFDVRTTLQPNPAPVLPPDIDG